MPEVQQKTGLSKEQKIGFVLLSVFAVFAVGLGVLQIRNTMYGPFALTKDIPPLDENQTNNIDSLRYRDTDHDSLTDFDELYIYSTSPYLADTDSDGIPDGDEITKGTNPLCDEKNQDCTGNILENGSGVPQSGVDTSSISMGTDTPNPGVAPEDLDAILSNPAKVRKLLSDNGVEQDVLDNTSDAELMQMVKELLTSSTAQTNIGE
jgi:hypothetical protein